MTGRRIRSLAIAASLSFLTFLPMATLVSAESPKNCVVTPLTSAAESCESWDCVTPFLNGGFQNPCLGYLVDSGSTLVIQAIWTPQNMAADWLLRAAATDLGVEPNVEKQCDPWSGEGLRDGDFLLTAPLELPPCALDGTGPWMMTDFTFIDANGAPQVPSDDNSGTMEIYTGPSRLA